VEKQVVIVEAEPPMASFPPPPPPSAPAGEGTLPVPMDVDPAAGSVGQPPPAAEPAEPKVVKSIWKSSYELLCPQHNPVSNQTHDPRFVC